MSDPVLEPEEVEALMKAVAPEEETDALFASLPELRQPKRVDDFQFSDDVKIGPDQYPMFGNLHERITEMATERWGNVFHREVPVFFKDLVEQSYLDVLDSETPRVYFTMDAPGLGSMLIVCDMSLVESYIDALLGGAGEIQVEEGDTLTLVEEKLAEHVASSVGDMVTRLWQPVRHFDLTLRRMDTDPMTLALTAEDVGCFSVGHIIVVGEEVRGELGLHYPLPFLEPMLEIMRSQERAKSEIIDEEWDKALRTAVNQIPLNITLELGRCHVQVRDFLHLKPGDMLPLLVPEEDPASIWVEDRPVFLAKPGQHQGMLAAEVLETIKIGGEE